MNADIIGVDLTTCERLDLLVQGFGLIKAITEGKRIPDQE